MEQTELQKLYEEIESLKARVTTLESIVNGCHPKRAGRKPILSLEQQDEVIQKHDLGMSYSDLAKEYKVAKGTISRICHGRPNSACFEKACCIHPLASQKSYQIVLTLKSGKEHSKRQNARMLLILTITPFIKSA